MNFNEAVERCRIIQQQMIQHGETAGRSAQLYSAHQTLFNVAAELGDKGSMELHRQTMHAMVDMILDSGAMVCELEREMKELGKINYSQE